MEQNIVFITLAIALVLFIWEKFRYDIVALLALFTLVVFNIIPAENAFSGFAHPAVITIGAILIISKALDHSGLVDITARILNKIGKSFLLQLIVLCVIVTIASAFMNNIGALGIMMPVAVQMARRNGYAPSRILMPIAFASILGGMTTLIGTPPNIIIATFRKQNDIGAFSMFDFTPTGGILAIAGLIFISLVGWRFLPKRHSEDNEDNLFKIDNYTTEVTVTEDSALNGRTLREMNIISNTEVLALGLVRNGNLIYAPSSEEKLLKDDIIILETDSDDLKTFVNNTGVKLTGKKLVYKESKGYGNIQGLEVVVTGGSPVIDKTAIELNIRKIQHVNVLAIARSEKRMRQRLGNIRLKAGDVLLLQGQRHHLKQAITVMQLLPLAERNIKIGNPRQPIFALSIFLLAILAVVFNVLAVEIAFSIAALIMVINKILPMRIVYSAIDWPIIVLLAAMIPVGEAFETSGGADLITQYILTMSGEFPIWVLLLVLITITTILSNVINNAATVILMAPIAIKIAVEMELSADPFLMAVALSASFAFLTPIGHQSNTLVMSPGGYKFSDYWKMGLPLTLILIILSVPVIMFFWPV
ncbi:SLC13 family permease [Salegentibacter sp.]|uniref:SLC13 family permease n=1 Tax=Salegentibacter sp. TaxID=1903072 RepID=UPI0035652FEE